MSADNWARCPKCLENKQAEYEKTVKTLKDSYGKVSLEEFKKLEAKKMNDEKAIEDKTYTLREDYEFYMTEDSLLQIRYKGRCTNCGAKYIFNKDVDFSST